MPTKSQNYLALTSLLGSLMTFSIVPIFTKLSEREISAEATIFHRFWISTVILILISGLTVINPKFKPKSESIKAIPTSSIPSAKNITFLGINAAFLAMMLLFFAWSITKTTVANCELINNMTPIFTVLGGWLIFKQQFDRHFVTGLAIAITGLVVIGFNDLQISADKIQGDLLALMSAVFLGGYLLGTEQLRIQLKTQTILLGSFGFGTPLTFLFCLTNQEQSIPDSVQGWLAVIGMAVAGLLAQGLLIYSLKQLASGLVAMVFLLAPFITAILAWIIFSETLSFPTLLAFFIVVGGIYLVVSSPSALKTVD